jgi:hypothetical protein
MIVQQPGKRDCLSWKMNWQSSRPPTTSSILSCSFVQHQLRCRSCSSKSGPCKLWATAA